MATTATPHGFVFRMYQTSPVRTAHGIGIERTLISEEWMPTQRACRHAAEHRAYLMNGRRVPGSSSGWSGNCRTHTSDPSAPNFDADAEWFLAFSITGEELFHGYRFGWTANVKQGAVHGPERAPKPRTPFAPGIYVMDSYAATAVAAVIAGPFADVDTAAADRASRNIGADCELYRFDGYRFAYIPESVALPHYGTAYHAGTDMYVDVHTTDSKSRTTITHPYRGVCVVDASELTDFTPGNLRAN